MRGRRRDAWLALAVVALAGAIRIAVVELAPPTRLVGDEHYYLEVAQSIAAGRGHHSQRLDAWAAWPPGQAFWLAAFVPAGGSVFDPSAQMHAARVAQALAGTALVALVALLGAMLGDARVGLLAALLAALHPDLVFFSHSLWATNLFVLLVTAAWCALLHAVPTDRDVRPGAALLAGLLFGLATLTRESALALAVGAALWCVATAPAWKRRGATGAAALVLLVCAATVVPWTARNALRTERFVPVSDVGWMAMREGNTLHPTRWLEEDGVALAAFRRAHYARPADERSRVARREALERIADAQPLWIFRKLVRNGAQLASPASLLLTRLSLDGYGEIPPSAVRGLTLACVGANALLLLLGVLGGCLARGRLPGFALAATLPLVALHVLANASPRYRMPLVPLLWVGAAAVLTGRVERPRASDWRLWIAVAFALFFAAFSLPHAWPEIARAWQAGTPSAGG